MSLKRWVVYLRRGQQQQTKQYHKIDTLRGEKIDAILVGGEALYSLIYGSTKHCHCIEDTEKLSEVQVTKNLYKYVQYLQCAYAILMEAAAHSKEAGPIKVEIVLAEQSGLEKKWV